MNGLAEYELLTKVSALFTCRKYERVAALSPLQKVFGRGGITTTKMDSNPVRTVLINNHVYTNMIWLYHQTSASGSTSRISVNTTELSFFSEPRRAN